jgi:hypothetical protein
MSLGIQTRTALTDEELARRYQATDDPEYFAEIFARQRTLVHSGQTIQNRTSIQITKLVTIGQRSKLSPPLAKLCHLKAARFLRYGWIPHPRFEAAAPV